MTYVITEPCIGTKDQSCVEVCPVDCIYDAGDHFMINLKVASTAAPANPSDRSRPSSPRTKSPTTWRATPQRPPRLFE